MNITVKSFFTWIFVLGWTLISSCSQGQPETPPNIVWITSEDNSKHFLRLFDPNGAPAPNIETLADHGIRFNNAFSNAPVCSVARSTLISSCYAPRIGAHYHRKLKKVHMPDGLRMFPAYLRDAGYYTTNNAKEDYNIFKGDDVWDESSNKASWRKRADGQPFFHVQNIGITHEGKLHFSKKQMQSQPTSTNPDSVFIPPHHPDTELFSYTYARYHDQIKQMDEEVGKILKELEKDNLMDETFIFYFGDHGGVLPGSKGYIKETGLEVPLVVYIPEKYRKQVKLKPGSETDGFVSFVDFGATVLKLAGVEVPEHMDGVPFLGKDVKKVDLESRDVSFSHADRFDEKYDLVRGLRVGKYKYIRNFQPFNIDALQNNYRYRMLAYQEWKEMHENGELNEVQSRFFQAKPAEELYDIEADPYETNNLAADGDYVSVLHKMRSQLREKMIKLPDLGIYPEHVFLSAGLDNPVVFGQEHREEIAGLLKVCDLQLKPFEEVKENLQGYLKSEHPLERYWALIVCSSFGEADDELFAAAEQVTRQDPVLINRVRAAEYLALTGHADPAQVIHETLESTTDLAECWLILNTVVLLKDLHSSYSFTVDESIFTQEFLEDRNIQERLLHINNLITE